MYSYKKDVHTWYYWVSGIVLVVIFGLSVSVASHDGKEEDVLQQQIKSCFGAVTAFLSAFAALALIASKIGKYKGIELSHKNEPQNWFHFFLVYGILGRPHWQICYYHKIRHHNHSK